MGGTGWCTHPKRQLSNDVRILVRKAELACRNSWGSDYWEAMDGADIDESYSSQSPPSDPSRQAPAPLPVSYEDEVTSVVNTDIHRAHTREDLNDRVVDQTSLGPDDQARREEDNEDRFDLLSRGGRDSVSHARNRMLRRRSGQPAPLLPDDQGDEDNAPDIQAHKTSFPPDDFVEEEAPSREHVKKPANANPSDDVILSEGVTPTTPRSRRLRRAGEQAPRPKRRAVVETEPDIEPPAEVSVNNAATRGQDQFDSVPEISSNIDLSVFRHSPDPASTRTPRATTISTPSATAPTEEPFERAVRNAQAIKAAARLDRDGRHNADRRPRATATREEAPEPHLDRFSDRSVHVQALDHQDAEAAHEPMQSVHERTGFSTRQVGEAGFLDQDGYDDEFDVDEESFVSTSRESRRNDARGSWWRGLFQSRRKQEQRGEFSEDAWDDEDGEGVYEDDSWIAASSEPWDDRDDPQWDNRAVDDGEDDRWLESEFTAPEADRIENPVYHTNDRGEDVSARHQRVAATPARVADYEPIDLHHEQGMSSFRDRLFAPENENPSPQRDRVDLSNRRTPIAFARKQATTDRKLPEMADERRSDARSQRPTRSMVSEPQSFRHEIVTPVPALDPADLLDHPDDAGYDPGIDSGFDVRSLVAERTELLDMTIQISPDVPRECATCRSYRQSEQGERGWCTNNWAFTHRQMVNATDLACQSTIGCWWIPADEEVWLIDDEPERGPTPRVDRLIAHLDPLKRAVGR